MDLKNKELRIKFLTEKLEKIAGKKVKLEGLDEHKDCGCGCHGAGTCKTSLQEGTWAVPYTKAKAGKIGMLLQGALDDKYDLKTVLDSMHNLYGDDALFDELQKFVPSDATKKAFVKTVQKYLRGLIKHYEEKPQDFKNKFELGAIEELKNILVTIN